MESVVLRFPNPARHVVASTPEPTPKRRVGFAIEEMKRLHRAFFGDRDAHLAGQRPDLVDLVEAEDDVLEPLVD